MRLSFIGLAAAAMLGASGASAQLITFDPAVACGASPCMSGNYDIVQSYGDTAFMDVTYTSLNGFGNSSEVVPNSAYYWDADYGDLSGVVYGGFDLSHILQIKFTALNGATLSLNGFQAGGYINNINAEYRLYDLNYGLLDSVMFVAPGTGHYQFSCATCTFSDGFILQFGPTGFDVGVDNIDVSAVPEPSSWALLIAGFGLTGAAMRRRRTMLA